MISRKQEALDYHRAGRKGKIDVVPTKPCRKQADLSLAYTPGVAEPCREIAKSPELSFEYTTRGNLVVLRRFAKPTACKVCSLALTTSSPRCSIRALWSG